MKAFPNKRSAALQEQQLHARRNPTAGRTVAESNAIRRDCERLRDNLRLVLDFTERAQLDWFPTADAITDTDDEAIIDWRAVAERKAGGYDVDEDGLLINMQDHGITASNRIEAVTVYNSGGADYMIRKTINCPFSCDVWGSLPLTLHQWRIIASVLIETRVLWQWTKAVNEYAALRDMKRLGEFTHAYTVGWNLVPPKKPLHNVRQERELWTGPIIYFLSTNLSLNKSMIRGCLI